MLFDLRGRGRRRTVQAIYLGLALLMGVGLVGFGIGGGFGGAGIFNAITNSGSSSASFSAQVSKDQKLVAAHPQSVADSANLVTDLFHEAGTGNNYNSNLGEFTTAARPTLNQLSAAWQHYLTLNPNNPDPGLAADMVQIYGPSSNGLNQPANALAAQQIVVSNDPNAGSSDYEYLALYAFLAHNTREGYLAAAKAIDLAPASQRAQLRTELKAIAANPTAALSASSTPQSTGPQTFSIPSTTPSGASTGTGTVSSGAATGKKTG
jgi:hypothetical protein